jgi:hypothetical protein
MDGTPRETFTRLGFHTDGQVGRIGAGPDTVFTGGLQATADGAPDASGGVCFRCWGLQSAGEWRPSAGSMVPSLPGSRGGSASVQGQTAPGS